MSFPLSEGDPHWQKFKLKDGVLGKSKEFIHKVRRYHLGDDIPRATPHGLINTAPMVPSFATSPSQAPSVKISQVDKLVALILVGGASYYSFSQEPYCRELLHRQALRLSYLWRPSGLGS